MKYEGKGISGRIGWVAAIGAVLVMAFAAIAFANNLDAQTAFNAAKRVAHKDCVNTKGCEDYFVRGLHKVSHHKAVGKIHVVSHKNGERFDCTRQIVVKLDHYTGEVNYSVSSRRCKDAGGRLPSSVKARSTAK